MWRWLFFPFVVFYGVVVAVRNIFYNCRIFKSHRPKIPVVLVGNLSTGGTGKTPMIHYLATLFENRFQLAILSRGYGRKTSGFVLANKNSTATDIGDEPLQFFQQLPRVWVGVQENRQKGIVHLQSVCKGLQMILMDDGFQHRRIQPKVKILLTPYQKPYTDDFLLPVGNLREGAKNAKRADIIVVSKCPEKLTTTQQKQMIAKINPCENQRVFFTKIAYKPFVINAAGAQISLQALQKYEVLLVTGIANPTPLKDFLTTEKIRFSHFAFPDHHRFTPKDTRKIERFFEQLNAPKKIILTTEKDAMRLQTNAPLFYLQINTAFFSKADEQAFEKEIIRLIGR